MNPAVLLQQVKLRTLPLISAATLNNDTQPNGNEHNNTQQNYTWDNDTQE